MAQNLFALFPTETDARRALQGLSERKELDGKYQAAIRVEPWVPVGDKKTESSERSVFATGRFGMMVGAGLGALLGALFTAGLHLSGSSVGVAMLTGGVCGAILSGLAGALIGRAFPDRNLQVLATRVRGQKVVLNVGVEDEASQNLIRQMLRKHNARRIATSEL
ncbi:MAG: hypothetical protein SF187_25795 [Deltaproteobacteria bacterium]|nr:hypothetical protein [Deltaproteobacteria bacterium]